MRPRLLSAAIVMGVRVTSVHRMTLTRNGFTKHDTRIILDV